MPTVIVFSGADDDHILVDEDMQTVSDKFSPTAMGASQLVQLTLLPSGRQRFEPGPVLVNPQRVAYLREPALGSGAGP